MSPAKTGRAACAALLCASAAAVGVPSAAYACAPTSGGDCSGATAAVNLAAGLLTLSAPSSVTINGTLGTAASFSQTMSTVQVDDSRGSPLGWTLSAATSGDLATAGPPVRTIALGTTSVGGPLTLATGPVTAVGLASLLNVTAGVGGSLTPSQPVTVATAAVGFGGGTYTMTPTLRLAVPPNTYAGNYSTTLTLSLTG
jgi:hypothetical protein